MNEKAIVYKLRLGLFLGILFVILYAAKKINGKEGMLFELVLMLTAVASVVFLASAIYHLVRYVHYHW